MPRKATTAKVTTAPPTVISPEDFTGDEQEQDQPSRPLEMRDDERPTSGQLAQVIQTLVDSQPVKRVPFAKRKVRSPFNPTGNRKRKLTRRCYQNGFGMDVKKLFDEEISLLNQLEPGRYLNNMVTVNVVENGGNTDLHIQYKNKTPDDKLALSAEFRSLREMLKRCVEEAAEKKTRKRAPVEDFE